MTEPMVRFEKVTKSYGPLTVLDELDLDVARGENWRSSDLRAPARPRFCAC